MIINEKSKLIKSLNLENQIEIKLKFLSANSN